MAVEIQFPKIPPVLSQSIVVHLIRDRRILHQVVNVGAAKFGSRDEADVMIVDGSRTVRVEVKGTGSKAFEHFGEKDLRADYIVWVHFGKYFLGPANEKINVITIRKPSDYFKPGRIMLKNVEKSNAIADRLVFDLNEL